MIATATKSPKLSNSKHTILAFLPNSALVTKLLNMDSITSSREISSTVAKGEEEEEDYGMDYGMHVKCSSGKPLEEEERRE